MQISALKFTLIFFFPSFRKNSIKIIAISCHSTASTRNQSVVFSTSRTRACWVSRLKILPSSYTKRRDWTLLGIAYAWKLSYYVLKHVTCFSWLTLATISVFTDTGRRVPQREFQIQQRSDVLLCGSVRFLWAGFCLCIENLPGRI